MYYNSSVVVNDVETTWKMSRSV